MKTRLIAMYLPQFHETEDNNRWWGNGFTDWVSVRTSEALFEGHRQPRVPLDSNYYDLSDVETIRTQAELARQYGIDGFGIYHYWFSTEKQTLTRPAELLLEHTEIDMPFFLSWDNNSWVRTWSKYQHNTNAWSPRVDGTLEAAENPDGVLAELDYGDEADWKIHFEYLHKFFSDPRYIRIGNKPLFVIWNYTDKPRLKRMCEYWRQLAPEYGYEGLFLMNRFNPYDSLDGFDALMTYEPMFSAWQNKGIVTRIVNKLKDMYGKEKGLTFYDYDAVWKAILKNARKSAGKNVLYGAFVAYDDTPRRGRQGKVVLGESPSKFEQYLSELVRISQEQNKAYIFLTAWNEWGEGAYLEPDEDHKLAFLEAVKRVTENK